MTGIADRLSALSPDARLELLRRLRGADAAPAAERRLIPRLPREGRDFPLSSNQERLWFLDQLTPANPFYNLATGQMLDIALDWAVLERAMAELARRHEALRTSFPVIAGEPVQRIGEGAGIVLETASLEALPADEREAEAQRRAAAFAARPFDVSTGPLCRALVMTIGSRRSLFAFGIHHIVADGWSLALLMRELGTIYADFASGRIPTLAPAPLQYVDYAAWQRDRAETGDAKRGLEFWRRQLKEIPSVELPVDRPRPRVQRYAGDQFSITLDEPLIAAARDVAGREGTTLFVVLLAAFAATLARHCDVTDLPIGVPVANRPHPDLEAVVGFFANTIVVRADTGGGPPFRDLVRRLHSTVVDALDHQETPFADVMAVLRPAPDLSRNPLFQVSFQLVAGLPEPQGGPAPRSASATIDRATSIFDLAMNLWEADARVDGVVEFDTDLFHRATIERLAARLRILLQAAVADPDEPLDALPLMPDDEREHVLHRWNATEAPLPDEPLVHRMFEAQARRTPEACAVRRGSASLTYRALDATAERLAHGLARLGAGRGAAVAVCLPPSPGLLVALLGVLKAGAAFVPLDPAAPAARSRAMLEDCASRLVLGDPSGPAFGAPVMAIEEVADTADPTPLPSVGAEDLAYIIFTSGSTGRPKGVMVPHGAVANYLAWGARAYPVAVGGGAPLCSPVSSDMAITTLFLPLVTGSTVVLPGSGHPVEELDRLLGGGERFDFVKLTPAHLEGLRALSAGDVHAEAAAALIVGGEALRGEVLLPWRDAAPDLVVVNEYGPTEATVACSAHVFPARECAAGPVPIGQPIANARLYVLDRRGAPQPIGVAGELYIGGTGVARGYIGRPDLTAERFVPDPFSSDPCARLYRTGDRARWRGDGVLEYIGRLDAQLKVRGYRVEPGEIEAALSEHASVREAAVVAQGAADEIRLCAFVVPTGVAAEAEGWPGSLRAHVAERLPAHMVPHAIVAIDALPLGASGKVDRRVLAARETAPANAPRSEPVPPRTAVEELLARIFADVTNTERCGVRDDFFAELGGHSLLAARVVARLRDLLGVEFALGRIFETPTVEGLAQALLADAEEPDETEMVARTVLTVLDGDTSHLGEMLDNSGGEDV